MKKITLLALLLAACRGETAPTVLDGFTQGTTYHIVVRDGVKSDLQNAVDSIFRRAEASMSLYDSTSLLSRVNRNQTDSLDEYIADCIALADTFSRETDGLFDVTIKPLTEAWGFLGDGAAQEIPAIESILEYVGYDKIRVEGHRLIKADPRVQLDLNAVAQGYTVDRVARHFDSLGLENYLIEMGGELFARGERVGGGAWTVGIDAPIEGNFTPGAELFATLRLSGRGLATSGNYRKFYEDSTGRKVVHTIDPRSGQPVTGRVLSATVVAPTAAEADMIGTFCMAAGLEKATEWLAVRPEFDAYIIYSDQGGAMRVFSTPGLEIVP